MTGDHLVAEHHVSRETMALLERYVALLQKWNPAINLIAKSTLGEIWDRHIVDSAQLAKFLSDNPAKWLDLGSGGGLPGLVLAILAREMSPDTSFHLVESDQRKATFLRQASRELDLPVTVHAARIEALAPMDADVVSARALAPLAALCGFAQRHLREGGIAVFPKGASYESEVDEARASWRFHIEELESMTNKDARLLKLSAIEHV
ncbi:MAG: 16S rRNA (guanine(527)-N(7))-methyltransferase RsmG [Aestuariivirga sp.]